MDLLNSLVATGLAALHGVGAQPATYRWGAEELTVNVLWGQSQFEELIQQVSGTRYEEPDAIIQDYAELLARRGEPQRGDEIEQNGIIRKVLPASDTGPVFQYSGNLRQALRIHTKTTEE